MSKKIIPILIVLVALPVLYFVFFKHIKPESDITTKTVEEVEEKIGNTSTISVPDNLKQPTDSDWQNYKDTNCINEDMNTICEYYIKTKNETAEKSTSNLEWNSFCAYIKKYKGEKTFTTGSYDYETLGYEEKPCHQGMYKQ